MSKLTPHQKAFHQWIEDFKQCCKDWDGVEDTEETNNGTWVRFKFDTKFGKMTATAMLSEYEWQVKNGWVEIYMRFSDGNAAEIAPHVWGDFNRFSGKWNFGFSGKEQLAKSRTESLFELGRRLAHVESKKLVSDE
jgi:hypothetical protein